MGNMKLQYAGIGARNAPQSAKNLMGAIAYACAQHGYELHTGAAKGADQAFAEGAVRGGGHVVLCLPWPKYEHKWIAALTEEARKTGALVEVTVIGEDEALTKLAYESVYEHHPNFNALTQGVQKLHARNYLILHQAKQVLCWTPGGQIVGGTGQGIRIAQGQGTHVTNLGDAQTYSEYWEKYHQFIHWDPPS